MWIDKKTSSIGLQLKNPELGMDVLRKIFKNGIADEMNLIIFSNGGISGSYRTIEDSEAKLNTKHKKDISFVIIHPRMQLLKYGNCIPKNQDDINFLKRLRESSSAVFVTIGRK